MIGGEKARILDVSTTKNVTKMTLMLVMEDVDIAPILEVQMPPIEALVENWGTVIYHAGTGKPDTMSCKLDADLSTLSIPNGALQGKTITFWPEPEPKKTLLEKWGF